MSDLAYSQSQTPRKSLQKAVIYCRVSSIKQVEEGHGLDSQETRCRDYAARKGYEIVEVFNDRGVSGGMIDRPGMQSMLGYLLHSADRNLLLSLMTSAVSRVTSPSIGNCVPCLKRPVAFLKARA